MFFCDACIDIIICVFRLNVAVHSLHPRYHHEHQLLHSPFALGDEHKMHSHPFTTRHLRRYIPILHSYPPFFPSEVFAGLQAQPFLAPPSTNARYSAPLWALLSSPPGACLSIFQLVCFRCSTYSHALAGSGVQILPLKQLLCFRGYSSFSSLRCEWKDW